MKQKRTANTLLSSLWDIWCVASVIGIWPRYIEPNLLLTTKKTLTTPQIPKGQKLGIVQLSDLHLSTKTSLSFLKKLILKTRKLNPSAIMITGDFLCNAEMKCKDILEETLQNLSKICPVYACLGNHDYSEYLTVNAKGEYTTTDISTHIASVFKRFFSPYLIPSGTHTEKALSVLPHEGLCTLLKDCNITLLHNQTVQAALKTEKQETIKVNITGLGEHMAGFCKPETAFNECDPKLFSIALSHNPDSLSHLLSTPAHLILCGHTHGGGVYIPTIWQRLTVMENRSLIRGELELPGKTAYIHRGLGATMPFRWFSPPELAYFSIEGTG